MPWYSKDFKVLSLKSLVCGDFIYSSRFLSVFCCMREHADEVGASAQNGNIKNVHILHPGGLRKSNYKSNCNIDVKRS